MTKMMITCGYDDKDDDAEDHANNAADPHHVVAVIVRDLDISCTWKNHQIYILIFLWQCICMYMYCKRFLTECIKTNS